MESRVRKPDVVHLSLPISKKGSANILTPNRSSYRLPTINQHATLIQGTRLGVGLTPSRHTPLESSRHLTAEVDGEAGLTPRPMFYIETTPSGQGRSVHAHLRRYHVARGSSSGGAGAQGRGPLESISPCYAVQSFHDCLLGESGDHVGQGQPLCKWVSSSALSRVSEPRPPKRPPTRRLLLPRTGLAHGSMVRMARLTLPVTSGSGKRDAAASRDGPPLGSDGRSWPSSPPGPCLR